jgi:hypothetical protein
MGRAAARRLPLSGRESAVREQMFAPRSLARDNAQGFWLSRPVPAERIEAALDAAGDAGADRSLPGAAA